MSVFDAVASTGLDVRDCRVPGYKGMPLRPCGVLLHHTASPARSGDLPSLGVCMRGRVGLPGPLCNVLVGRTGTVAVISEGRANHAGVGSWPGITDGNGQLIGVEAENDGVGEPWSDGVLDVLRRITRALCDRFGFDLVIGHKEWAPGRKVDPSFDMDWFRSTLRTPATPSIIVDQEALMASTSPFQLVDDSGTVMLFVPGQRAVLLGGLPGPHTRLAHNGVAPLAGPPIPAGELAEFMRRWDASIAR